MPLLFRNHLEGPYWDWHVGDLIEIDAAGNGLTLVKTDVYRKIEKEIGGPWYSVDYGSFKGINNSPANNTEDLYFYWKARRAGYRIWADTSIQAYHFDKTNSVMYGMPMSAPQANPAWEVKPHDGGKLIADIGSGPVTPYMHDEGKVVSFDIREDMKPDVVCDVRHLPVPNETFDVVFSSHTLEHFSWTSVDKVLKEWVRVLKVGGELRLVVPNLKFTAKRILDDTLIAHDYWVLYGEQDYPKNFHAVGFTPQSLKALVESLGIFEDIQIKEGNIDGPPEPNSWNLQLKATKVKNTHFDNIAPDWIEPGPPSNEQWPVRLYNQYNTRPMDPDEILKDKLKWLKPSSEEIPQVPELNVFRGGGINSEEVQKEPPKSKKKKLRDSSGGTI
jgi:predicted SAM-dependent methyltransferase